MERIRSLGMMARKQNSRKGRGEIPDEEISGMEFRRRLLIPSAMTTTSCVTVSPDAKVMVPVSWLMEVAFLPRSKRILEVSSLHASANIRWKSGR